MTSYFSGVTSLFSFKLYLVLLKLSTAIRDKSKAVPFTQVQSFKLCEAEKNRKTCSAKEPIKMTSLFLKRWLTLFLGLDLPQARSAVALAGWSGSCERHKQTGAASPKSNDAKIFAKNNEAARVVKNIFPNVWHENPNLNSSSELRFSNLNHSATAPSNQLFISTFQIPV